MQYLITTLKGLEPVAKQEIKEILKTTPRKVTDTKITLKTNNINKYLKKAKTIIKLSLILKRFKFKTKQDIINKITKTKLPKQTFALTCKRIGNHKFNSQNITSEAAKLLKTKHKLNFKAKKKIEIDIYDNFCFITEPIKENLNKRPYRFKRNNQSIDATIASSLIKLSAPAKSIIDPFCLDCIIPLEAHFLKIKNIHAFDNNKNNIRNAKINIKLAKAKITISQNTIDWMDTLFKKNSTDLIATNLPFSKRNIEPLKKQANELFHQAKYILKKSGTLAISTTSKDMINSLSKKFSFKTKHHLEIDIGNQKYHIFTLKP